MVAHCWGAAGMPIRPFLEPGEFDPKAVTAMSEAFDAACKQLHYEATRTVLEVIAERIVAAARTGERDPIRLREAALVGLPREE